MRFSETEIIGDYSYRIYIYIFLAQHTVAALVVRRGRFSVATR